MRYTVNVYNTDERNIAIKSRTEKLQYCGYPTVKKIRRLVGYTIVWSGIRKCNECIPRETMV